MEPAHLIVFNLTLLAAIAAPGPSILFLIRATLSNGRRVGVITAAGLGCMAAAWTLAALLGLDSLFNLFPWAYATLKTLGALYLIWIAISTWRSAHAPVGEAPVPSGRRAFLSGLMVNLGNPKSVIFAAAVIIVIFPPDLTGADKALIVANHLLVELTVQPLLAVLISTNIVRNRYLNAKPLLDRFAAAVLGTLGLRLLIER
ncbi:MAG: threonine/homoserine/homoserine lactone efflux protein [Paracoccaceae bacterium]|jgi:threonine/homoserine/homoserine lactone efflux protein